MNIGVSTSCLYPLQTENALETVAKAGVTHTEIFLNALCETEMPFADKLDSIRREYGITVTSIHPTMSVAESYVLYSDYERRYNEGIDLYKRYAQIAARLGAKYVIMHGGKPSSGMDAKRYSERFSMISEAVAQNGATLLQENVALFLAGDLDFLKQMANELGDKVGFCLDVKQARRGGYSPLDVLKEVGKNVKHLHISDHGVNEYGNKRDCLLPTNGVFDFKEFFKLAESVGFEGDAMIEVYNNCYKNYDEIFASLERLKSAVF